MTTSSTEKNNFRKIQKLPNREKCMKYIFDLIMNQKLLVLFAPTLKKD